MFRNELFAGDGDITIWLNSPDGDCIAASQIYSLPNNISLYENYYGKFWNDSAANGALRKIIEINGDMDSTVCGFISDKALTV